MNSNNLKIRFKRAIKESRLKDYERYCVILSKKLIGNENGENIYDVSGDRYFSGDYGEVANRLIKQKYSDSEEFALLRKSITNPNNEEFITYNAYVEQCKVEAKAFIEERKQILGR